MMRTCDVFDKYRDGELDSAGRSAFERHLVVCAHCRTKTSLLNNLAHVLRQEKLQPLDLADRIAHRAFRRGEPWDALVVSWLRPGPAMAAVALMLVLFSFLWLMPGREPADSTSEYETLMDEADAINAGPSVSQVHTDSELVVWLEQEGNTQ